MYRKSRLIFTCIVWCSLPEWGKTCNVFTVSHGTLTTFPRIFFCPPRGASNTFINGILGETSLHSTWCKSWRCLGISGKPIPFAAELGGIFFFFKWLKHVLQINFFLSLCFISDTHACKAGQSGRLILCKITTRRILLSVLANLEVLLSSPAQLTTLVKSSLGWTRLDLTGCSAYPYVIFRCSSIACPD